MGWGSASSLFSEIIKNVQPHIADVEVRKKIYLPLIEAFRDQDWDTYDECRGEDPAYDAALLESLGWDSWGDEDEGDDD